MRGLRDGALVLLADRDRHYATALEAALRRERLHTERVGEAGACLEMVRRLRPDAVVVADRLGSVRATDVLCSLGAVSDVPVIVLLKEGGTRAELVHFGLGAADVVSLPASPRVVAARVARILERASARAERSVRRLGPLVVDLYRNAVSLGEAELDLTPVEYRLLVALASAPGRAFTRSELIGESMPESDALERSIDVHICTLRRKLAAAGAPRVVETIRGVGYRANVVAPEG